MFLFIFVGVYGFFLGYVWISSRKPWRLEVDREFEPNISILIPMHNEEKIIASKLSNIRDILYPKQKMEIIVADDASEDKLCINCGRLHKKQSRN